MSARHLEITLNVNGEPVAAHVESRKTLVDFLREDLALTGSHAMGTITICAVIMQAAMNKLLACWWLCDSFSPINGSMAALAKWKRVIAAVKNSRERFWNRTDSRLG
jgi:xanthine dehydrogenase iron-sulfur cluster and FAD-binding subunit A